MIDGWSQLVEVAAGEVRWHVLPECRERLLGPDGLRLDEWLRAGQARVVKHGPHRSVYAVSLADMSFYVKHNRVANTRAWLRELVRPSKARMEFERAIGVAAREVATIAPLAVGERPLGMGRRESFLVTQALNGTQPLDVFLENTLPTFQPARQAGLRQRLARTLGEFLARMHDAGILHDDLHAGNVVVGLDEADLPSLYLLDLHGIHLGQSLNWRSSRDNLVVFNRWFMLHASRADRLRFWRQYFQARSDSCPWPEIPGIDSTERLGVLARDLEARTLRSNLHFWKQRDRRCLIPNRHYRSVRAAGIVSHVVADLDASVLASLLADPDEPLRRPGVTVLKNSPTSKVVEFTMTLNAGPCRVVYKRFGVKSRSFPWLSLLRLPPALRSWVHGQGMRERCLPTARPLMVLHRRRAGLLREGYLLSVKIPGAVELPRFLDELGSLPPANRLPLLRDRIEQTARLIRELHRRKISHRDLKGANILTTGFGSPTSDRAATGRTGRLSPNVWIIDLAGVTLPRRLRETRKVQNLARLHASVGRHPALTRTDKLRFLRIYLQWGLFGKSGWKAWWRSVEKATRAKVERNAGNGRPLG